MADSDIHARITAERAAASPDARELKVYRDYLLGRQKDVRTPAQKDMFPEIDGRQSCENICQRVVTTPANRLTIARFEVEAEGATKDALDAFIARVSLLNALPTLVLAVTAATLRDGDHVVGINWVAGFPRFQREAWWNGEDGFFVAYDQYDLPEYGVKEWSEGDTRRRVIFFPDRIERYRATLGGAWELHPLPDDPEMVASMLGYLKNRNLPVADYPPGVLPWLDRDGGPLGLPFVHFANRLLPNDGPGGARARSADSRYGVSALAGGVVAAQDRLNLIHWDILTSSGFTGSQMLWGTGVTPPRNQETGKVEPYQIVPGAIITDGSKDARFGTFPPGQITAHERALQVTKEAVAQIAELPLVFIMTEAPSGEALMRGEAGLAEKVDKLGEATGPTWASLQHKGTRLANTFANAELDEQARIATVFTAAQRINLVGVADAVAKLAAVFGVREAARQAGLQPSDIERIVDELAEDDAAFDRAAGGAAATLAAELGRVGG